MLDLDETIDKACDAVPGRLSGALVLVPDGMLIGGFGGGGASVDVLFDAVGSLFPEQRARAHATLAQIAGPGRRAAAFVFDADRKLLLPVAELGGQGVGSLRVLAHWVAAFPRASLELATDPRFTLAATSDGESVLIWWREGLLFTVMCEDRAALAAATAQHLARA